MVNILPDGRFRLRRFDDQSFINSQQTLLFALHKLKPLATITILLSGHRLQPVFLLFWLSIRISATAAAVKTASPIARPTSITALMLPPENIALTVVPYD